MKKSEIQSILNEALTTEADYGELFFEKTISNGINVMIGEVINISVSELSGVEVRLLKGSDEIYTYTNDVNKETIMEHLEQLKASINDTAGKVVPLGDKKPFNNNIKKPFDQVPTSEKTVKLLHLNSIIKNESRLIVQAITNLSEKRQEVFIANTEGIYQDDERIYTRVILASVAKVADKMEQTYDGPSRFMGLEICDEIDFDTLALDVATSSVKQFYTKDIKAGATSVLILNGFGGVIFHVACG